MRALLIAAIVLTLGACAAKTGNEVADVVIETAPHAVFWWLVW